MTYVSVQASGHASQAWRHSAIEESLYLPDPPPFSPFPHNNAVWLQQHLLGIGSLYQQPYMPAVGSTTVLLADAAWHFQHTTPASLC